MEGRTERVIVQSSHTYTYLSTTIHTFASVCVCVYYFSPNYYYYELGRAGGACTSALLQVIYNQHDLDPTYHNLSFMDVFLQTRDVIEGMGYQQVPQLSSSRRIDIHQPFNMMKNDTSGGTRYAVLIGINYTSHKQGQLSGCHNDVGNIKKYIMDVGKIKARNITTLMDDDGISIPPTKRNIMKAFDELTRKCQPGDCAFVHYSGKYIIILIIIIRVFVCVLYVCFCVSYF